MAYSEKVIEHYENPRNVGSFDKDDPNVGTGLVGAPACGDVMQLQIKVNRDGRHRGRQVQDLRLRLGHRVVVARDRVGQGQDARRGADDQEHADRRGAEPAAGEDSLLGARRGRDQGRHRRLPEEASSDHAECRGCDVHEHAGAGHYRAKRVRRMKTTHLALARDARTSSSYTS